MASKTDLIIGADYRIETSIHRYYFRYMGRGIDLSNGCRVHHYYTSDINGCNVQEYNCDREWKLVGFTPTRLTDDEVIDQILMVII